MGGLNNTAEDTGVYDGVEVFVLSEDCIGG